MRETGEAVILSERHDCFNVFQSGHLATLGIEANKPAIATDYCLRILMTIGFPVLTDALR